MYFKAKYGQQTTFRFAIVKRGVVDLAASADWTPATGDTKISKDGGNVANSTNNPSAVGGTGSVTWALTLTGAELQAAEVNIQIVDSATKAVEDQFLTIYTYGHQNAKEVFDYDSPFAPHITDVTATQFGTDTTSHAVSMPATVDAGDLLICLFANDGSDAVTTPTGWTSKSSTANAAAVRLGVYAKRASGTEGGTTVDFVTAAAQQAAAQVYRVKRGEWSGKLAHVSVGTAATGSSTAPDSPTLSPDWNKLDTLFISVAANQDGTHTTTAFPTNYVDTVSTVSAASANGVNLASATRRTTAASENPSAYTIGTTDDWVAQTIAIKQFTPTSAPEFLDGGNDAVLTLKQINVLNPDGVAVHTETTAVDSNVVEMIANASGAGSGLFVQGASGGGDGILTQGDNGGTGLHAIGGVGIGAESNGTGAGISAVSGGTNSAGITAQGGHGFEGTTSGTNKFGFHGTSDTASLAFSIASSGTTTTFVDASRTEADTDYWKGDYVLFVGGNLNGQCRLITAFNPTTDTITFSPATTQTVANGQAYLILPSARSDIQSWLGSTVNSLVSGRVDASAGNVATDAITAASLAQSAVTEIRSVYSGTAATGSTSFLTDTSIPMTADNDWRGSFVLITSGANAGMMRMISASATSDHSLSFSPAFPNTANGQTFEIIPFSRVDLQLWAGAGVSGLVSGKVSASVQDMANDVLTASAIAADAITAAKIASDAITAAKIASDAITAAKIAGGAIDAATLAADMDTYQAKVWVFDDNSGSNDRYVVVWHKNGQPITSGITSPTIQVIKVSDGTDLVASTAMTQIGTTGMYRYNEGTNRIANGAAYVVKVTASIDSGTRTWFQPVGRDSA